MKMESGFKIYGPNSKQPIRKEGVKRAPQRNPDVPRITRPARVGMRDEPFADWPQRPYPNRVPVISKDPKHQPGYAGKADLGAWTVEEYERLNRPRKHYSSFMSRAPYRE